MCYESVKKKDFRLCSSEDSTVVHSGRVPFITFKNLDKAGVVHGFSTRLGGVSDSFLSSMNLSFSRGDDPENVRENYRRISSAVGFNPDELVFTDQQHHDRVLCVGSDNAGSGYLRNPDFTDVDGILTDEKGVVLAAFFADCCGVLLYDPVRKCCGAVHSGWRGAAKKISGKAVKLMESAYQSDPEEILAAIVPCICRSCYEVGEEVREAFLDSFGSRVCDLFDPSVPGHYMLDLKLAVKMALMEAGVSEHNICTADICTKENSRLLYSHRASGGRRGNLAAFITLDPRRPELAK